MTKEMPNIYPQFDETNDLDELLERLLHDRDDRATKQTEAHGFLSSAAVERLVRMAYFAGMTLEEGKYARFRITVAATHHGRKMYADGSEIIPFAEPQQIDDVHALCRLAASMPSHDFALEFEEVRSEGQSTLQCIGIRRASIDFWSIDLFSPSPWHDGVPEGLMIRVDGPGFIRVTERHHVYSLRPGNLVVMGNFPIHPIQQWQDDIVAAYANGDDEVRAMLGIVTSGWNEILRIAAEKRRGACFLILPTAAINPTDVGERYGLQLKVPTQGPDLGREMSDFIKSCFVPGDTASDVLRAKATTWARGRSKLMTTVEALAFVAGVDGCTVFSRDLRLLGYAGRIDVPTEDPMRQLLDFANHDQPIDPAVFKRTGTRHYSAYRFCDRYEGASGYIVSQDGDVTLFWSQRDSVRRWQPYWPYSSRSDHS